MQNILRRLVVVTAAMATASCEQFSPAKVCAAEETTSTVRSLVLEILVGDPTGVDLQLVQRAFDDEVELDLVRFEGFEQETSTIRCRARLIAASGAAKGEVTYTRQPDLGNGDYVYGVELVEPGAWRLMSVAVVRRYRALQPSNPEQSPPDEAPPPPQELEASTLVAVPEEERTVDAPPAIAGPPASGRFRLPLEANTDGTGP